ncbi:MAG: M4 family metallopeptidase [Gloeotrichia echinulata GP01]
MVQRQETALDYFGRKRTFFCEENQRKRKQLEDKFTKVYTHYLNLKAEDILPGRYVFNPPAWKKQTVSAHANASDVARFFRDVLEHQLQQTNNQAYISSLISIEDPYSNYQLWENCMWFKDYQQVVFGQTMINGLMRSYATAKDIVAHDFSHALISWTADLEYQGQSGALNESYADIFAIMFANFPKSDINKWRWKLGEGFGKKGGAIRDISCPSNYGQAEHMNDYRYLLDGESPNEDNDWGWVHHNSGIHNKVAYYLITSKNPQGHFMFDSKTIAVLFYQTLIRLRKNSDFTDSYRLLLQLGKTLFRADPLKAEKIQTINNAFAKVGIAV